MAPDLHPNESEDACDEQRRPDPPAVLREQDVHHACQESSAERGNIFPQRLSWRGPGLDPGKSSFRSHVSEDPADTRDEDHH